MPVEQNKPIFFLQMGDTRFPISAIQEVSDLSDNQNYDDSIKTNMSMSFSFDLGNIDVQDFVINCLKVERRYLKGKYTKCTLHLIKYGKTKRVRNKNWKRSFGKRVDKK